MIHRTICALTLAVACAGGALVAPAQAVTIAVTTAADAGPGSFRDAADAASTDPSIDTIAFDAGLGTIVLSIANGAVVYSGTQDLTIAGGDASITSEAGGTFDLFRSTGGGNLWISDLTFTGGGANGIAVHLPAAATGTQGTSLDRVTVTDNADNGLLIEDQVDESDAGIALEVIGSTFTGNGTPIASGGNDDRDGIRVNEGGLGGVTAGISDSRFEGNAYDGVEIDERGEGTVAAGVSHSTFDDNGFGNDDDTEDGFDIDEADGGDIAVDVVHSSANGNFDEGFDFSETNAGDLRAHFNQASANRNEDEGIKIDETEDGNLDLQVNNSTVSESLSQDGVELAESGAGKLNARFVQTTIADNDNFGIRADEDDAGSGALRLQSTTIVDNGDGATSLDDVTITKQKP
jgi:hypothetical protein